MSAFLGARGSSLPMPPYKPLLPYFDAVKDLLRNTTRSNTIPRRAMRCCRARATKRRAASGLAPDGKPLAMPNHRHRDIRRRHRTGDVGDAEAQRRRRIFGLPPDFNSRFQKGEYVGSIYGHGGSIREPYDTMRLYQSNSIAVPGGHRSISPAGRTRNTTSSWMRST